MHLRVKILGGCLAVAFRLVCYLVFIVLLFSAVHFHYRNVREKPLYLDKSQKDFSKYCVLCVINVASSLGKLCLAVHCA